MAKKKQIIVETDEDGNIIKAEEKEIIPSTPAEKAAAEETIRKARYLARTVFPYLSQPLTAMSIKITDDAVDNAGNPTFAVDRKMRTYIHPKAVVKWQEDAKKVSRDKPCETCGKDSHHPLAYLAGVFVHEMWHPMRKHMNRADAYADLDFSLWNVAADCFPAGTLLPGGRKIEDYARKVVENYKGDLVEITSQHGSIKATPDHRILVRKRKHKVGINPVVLHDKDWCAISDINVGDYVLVPKNKHTHNVTKIDLTKYHETVTDSLGRTNNNRALKQLPLNEDTAWMMGLWTAEGSASQSGTDFSLNANTEMYLAERLESIAKSFERGTQVSIRDNTMKVSISSVVLGRFLAAECGRGAFNKKIPDMIMQHSNPAIRKAYLDGLVTGDGCITKRGGSPYECVTLGSVSEALIFDVILLLAQDGIGAHRGLIKRGPRQIGNTWTNKELVLHTLSWNPAGNTISTRVLNGKEITTTHGRTKSDEDGVWYPVKKTTTAPYEGHVYDMVNMEDHRYVANGIAVHNCEINDGIQQFAKTSQMNRLCLPPGGCFPSFYKFDDNLLAEEYYGLLQKKVQENKSFAKSLPAGGRCGSGADGKGGKAEKGDNREGSSNDPNEANDGISEGEMDIMAKRVAAEIQESAAKQPGSVPASLVRWAGELLGPPKYNWKRELSQLIRYCCSRYVSGNKTPTYARLSKISVVTDYDVILPTFKKPTPSVALVIDTSGSVSQKALAGAIREAEAICKATKTRINVIDCDIEARSTKVRKMSQAQIQGGGGTDMRVGIAKALEEREKPNLIVLFTDGYTPYPEEQIKGTKLIVCLVGENVTDHGIPSWASIVKVPEEDGEA